MKKVEERPSGDFLKFPEKIFKMRFLNSVTVPKNVKGRTLWDFLTSIVLQNIETDEVEESKKFQKKSHSAEKNPSEKHQMGNP